MFNRTVRNKLPELPMDSYDQVGIQERNKNAKRKMKAYANNKAYVKPQNTSVGDTVIVKRDPSRMKSDTPFDPQPYVVIEQKGTMVTAERDDKEITRNSSLFKRMEENKGV